MSVCVQLHLKDKKILLVGGGHVAYRKAQQFLKEGALVSIVSPSFLDDLKKFPLHFIQRNYQRGDCEGFFYVYATTDDKQVNHQVLMDSNQRNILCGSATKDELVSTSSMSTIEETNILCAVSTQGEYPAWNTIIKEEISVFLQERYQEKSSHLKKLREYILKSKIDFTLWKELAGLLLEEIIFLEDVVETQQCCLYAFHGVVNPAILQGLYEMMRLFKHTKAVACGIVFLSNKVCGKLHHQVSSLSYMTTLIKALGIHTIEVYPMLVGEGVYEHEVRLFCEQEKLKCHVVLCATQSQSDAIIDAYVTTYPSQHLLLMSHDELALKTWNYLQTSTARYEHVHMITCKDTIMLDKHQEVTVVPFVMLLGHHAKQDILHGEQSICAKLNKLGCKVTKIEEAIFDQTFIKQLYMK